MRIKLNETGLGIAALAIGLGAAPVFANLHINATFDSSISNSAYASTIESEINNSLSFYDNSLSNPIDVNIYFKSVTGASYLGASQSTFYTSSLLGL